MQLLLLLLLLVALQSWRPSAEQQPGAEPPLLPAEQQLLPLLHWLHQLESLQSWLLFAEHLQPAAELLQQQQLQLLHPLGSQQSWLHDGVLLLPAAEQLPLHSLLLQPLQRSLQSWLHGSALLLAAERQLPPPEQLQPLQQRPLAGELLFLLQLSLVLALQSLLLCSWLQQKGRELRRLLRLVQSAGEQRKRQALQRRRPCALASGTALQRGQK